MKTHRTFIQNRERLEAKIAEVMEARQAARHASVPVRDAADEAPEDPSAEVQVQAAGGADDQDGDANEGEGTDGQALGNEEFTEEQICDGVGSEGDADNVSGAHCEGITLFCSVIPGM